MNKKSWIEIQMDKLEKKGRKEFAKRLKQFGGNKYTTVSRNFILKHYINE